MTTPKIFDRTDESTALRGLLARGTPQLALIHGRRRVGKTHLLSHLWLGSTAAFYFTAAETTPSQNREALIQAFATWSGQALTAEDYPTWRTVFRLLLSHESTHPLVITIDEFQYLGDDDQGLRTVASELNAEWERTVTSARHLLVVLSGSAVRTMARLNTGGAPLYGRFDWQHRLQPFDYWDAGQMSGFTAYRDQARAYGVFGGTPRYLAGIEAHRSWAENVQRLMLAPDGSVRDLVRTALQQEQGLRDLPKYTAILRAIGGGRVGMSKLGQLTQQAVDTALREKLERLEDLGYVRGTRNVGAKPNAAKRYHLADPAFRFYYTLVAPWESLLAMNAAARAWEDHLASRFDTLMGHVFEDIAEAAYTRRNMRGAGLPIVTTWGRWDGQDRHRQSVEIDIVAPLAGGGVMTGAIKWNRTPIDRPVHLEHLEAIGRLAASGVEWAHGARQPEAPLLYVAAGGFTKEFVAAATSSRAHVILWTLDDIFTHQ